MENLGRILFLLPVVFFFTTVRLYSQVIEKAPPSPVTVQSAAVDSVNALVQISDIILTGFRKTKAYIIQREVPFKKGDYILSRELAAKLNLCKQQLINTSLFVDVDIKLLTIDSNHVFVDIEVKERWYLFPIPYFKIVSRNFNEWWVEENHRLDRIEYGLKFMQNNVSGRNDNLNVWLISGYTQQISLRYDNPNIDNKLKNGINFGFGFSNNRELNYGMDPVLPNKLAFVKNPDKYLQKRMFADFAYTYRPAIKTRHTFRISYNSLSVDNEVIKLNSSYLPDSAKSIKYPDISYTLSYQNVDYNPYPLKGFSGEASFYKRFGKKTDIWQLSGRANYSVKLFPSSFLQLQAVGLIKVPFNQPYISDNLMGSPGFYMRGLEYYVIEGVAGGIARATVKNEVLSFNFRNPVKSSTHDKIPFRVFLKAYTDLGYSYSPDYGISVLNNKLLRTWGVGIDIITFYDIVLRFEYSFNQLGGQGLFFHNQNDF